MSWDVAEVAGRLGDTIETVLRVDAHQFDARRRSGERRAALEGLYGSGDGSQMSTDTCRNLTTDAPKPQYLRAVDDA